MPVRERCYRTCVMYRRRWEIGEEREVDQFDENGKPIISTHFREVEASEASSEREKVVSPSRKLDEEHARLREDRVFSIRQGLEQLNPEDNADWTIKGQPSVPRLYAITGITDLQRADVVEAWPEFDRELARENKAK